jgi:hypothetical protein
MPDRLESGDPVSGNWPKVNRALDLHDANGRRVAELRQRHALKRGGRGNATDALFPFKLYLAQWYQIPDNLIDEDEQEIDWRTFLVRAGRVEDKVLDGDGCDYYDDDPDSDYYPTGVDGSQDQTQQVTPIVIPADTDVYWFWIEIIYDETGSDGTTAPANGNPSCAMAKTQKTTTTPKTIGKPSPNPTASTSPSATSTPKPPPASPSSANSCATTSLPAYKVNACDENNNPIKLHIPAAFKEPDAPDA